MAINRFFKPFVGTKYKQGINGKRVLVLGASFYCPNSLCQYFPQCTDVNRKDSSQWDTICPVYSQHKKVLHNEPSYCIDDAPQTYCVFARCVAPELFGDTVGYQDFWQHFAFTNYVQFFLPAIGGVFRETLPSDMSERDFKAFIETVQELQPDIVIVWGTVINKPLINENPLVVSLEMLEKSEEYVCYIRVPGVEHDIALINPYHPSSPRYWNAGFDKFKKYMLQLLGM